MKTITWPELWPKEKLIAAEAAHSCAAEALRQAELALRRIDDEPSARCVALQEEIDAEHRRHEDASWEESEPIDCRCDELIHALSQAEMAHEDTRPARLAALEAVVSSQADALAEAQDELAQVKKRVEMAHHLKAPGPIYAYGTLSAAVREVCPVRIESNQLGETYAQVEGVRIRITGNASLTSIPPVSLSWVPKSSQHPEAATPALEILPHVVYIEDADRILIRKNPTRTLKHLASYLDRPRLMPMPLARLTRP